MAEEFQKIRMAVNRGPDLHFEGRLVGEYSTQNKAETKDRWQELRLWETRSGAWVAEMVARSSRHGEGDFVTADAYIPDGDYEAARSNVMETFEWSPAAKAFARTMGWDVVVRIE